MAEAARDQRNILGVQDKEAQLEAHVKDVMRQLDARAAAFTKVLYQSAKAGGIKMAPVRDKLAGINMGRRNSGVWELVIAEEIDGPYLVVVRDLTDRETQFAVEGVGLYGMNGHLRDDEFKKTGVFSPNCQYEIYWADTSRKYPCQDYLSGKIDQRVYDEMATLFGKSLAQRP
ncbi:hypothetical protein [Hydrogenophaga sp.]|uniref:hypothetical protein n=1 Tax=Hydrogenophaga sp. TaxID=1904254 RepID=UPI002716C4AF|nr:hypothetical protein [Hydrogenophaga sp.]MDO9435313.1 hypothetical protein [Hydrogenophaga sp.]